MTTQDKALALAGGIGGGTPTSVNALRDDLSAAQVPKTAWGGCFRAAERDGDLTTNGFTVHSDEEKARARRVLVYRVNRRPNLRKTAA